MLYSPEFRPEPEDWIDYLETIETDADYPSEEPEYENTEPEWDEDIPF